MGRYSRDTKVSRLNQLVTTDPILDQLLDGDAFYWLDHFKVKAGKKKKILLWRDNPDYLIKLNLYVRSKVKMTLDMYGDPVITELGDQVTEPPSFPRNICPDKVRMPSYKIYMDGEYESGSGIHAGSMRIDIGFHGNVRNDLTILAHHPSDAAGTLLEIKNIDTEDDDFNILVSWAEILERSLSIF